MSRSKKDKLSVGLKYIDEKQNEALTAETTIKQLKNELKTMENSNVGLNINNLAVPNELSDIEDEIIELKKRTEINLWLIGQRLKFIRDNNLFREKGFKAFHVYCTENLHFSPRWAYKLIWVHQNIDFEKYTSQPSKYQYLEPVKEKSELLKLIDYIDKYRPSVKEVKARVKEITNRTKKRKPKSKSILLKKSNKTITINRSLLPKAQEEKVIEYFKYFFNYIDSFKVRSSDNLFPDEKVGNQPDTLESPEEKEAVYELSARRVALADFLIHISKEEILSSGIQSELNDIAQKIKEYT